MAKSFKRVLSGIVVMMMLVTLIPAASFADESGGGESNASLVPQNLDYTENAIDIPNPDRGFYRANDGLIVPVSGTGSGSVNVGNSPVTVGGAQVTTRVSHMYFDLKNYSSNTFTARGTRYNSSYRAPAEVSIRSRSGDQEPYDYDTHFEYWQENVLPTWPHGETQPITEDGLDYISGKLQQVRDGNGVAMVRFNYDGAGYGWVDVEHPDDGYVDRPTADIEPDKDTILEHIAQLKPILHEYEDILMGVDGGMFGPWGEMHSTTFGTSPEAYAWLLNAWLDAVPKSRSIAVQGGAFLSWYNDTYDKNYTFENIDQIPAPKRGTPEARFGFFNDSYGYGEDEGDDYPDDWGSLSEGAGWPGDPLGDEDSYDRGRIMTWIRNQNNLYGGEAQGGRTLWNTYPFVAWEASYAQTVYLNADYSGSVHNRWRDFVYNEENVSVKMTNAYEEPYKTEYAIFDPVYDGRTGAEYWRDRLGYRLVLRDANAIEWVAQDGTLEFEGSIQNVGFGNIVNKKNVSVVLKSKKNNKTYTALTDIDARDWRPDLDSRATNTDAYRDLNFSIDMTEFGRVPVGEYDIYLKINDPKEKSDNKRCIRFANNGTDIWDADLGANLIGTTLVKAAEKKPIDAEALRAEIKALYESGLGSTGRTHKMQAFIMEIALHAKTRNPDFKIIPQDGIDLAFVDGSSAKGLHESLISLVDGWGIEGMVGTSNGTNPGSTHQKWIRLVEEGGLMVTDTTSCSSQANLDNYYARAEAWGIIPYPRVGGTLAQTLFPGLRWGNNGDYFWVEDPDKIGIGERIDGERNVVKLTDAKNYLYHINGRPYDAWETWDAEEAEYEEGDGDRTRIADSYGCGLLVPSEGGQYKPTGSSRQQATIDAAIAQYGEEWDWWWRAAGLDESAGRETWIKALQESDYDVIYIDSFYNHRAAPENQTPMTREEVESLKYKPDGGRRQIIAYLSVGSAEQNRWYCQDDWVYIDPDNPNTYRSMKAGTTSGSANNRTYAPNEDGAPPWLAFGYGGNYQEEAIVQWWHPAWRDIIINGGGEYAHKTTGDNTSSIDRIIDQGFDGVYLDNVGVYNNGSWTAFENYWNAQGGLPGEGSSAPLLPQGLDYTENPVDIPNPDRGFERGNDDAAGLGDFLPGDRGSNYWGYMTVPADKNTILGQPFAMAYEMKPPLYLGGAEKGPEYCNVPVEPRVVQFYLVLNNFSSNAWCDSKVGDPSAHEREGMDGPITEYGLDFIENQLKFIRNNTNSVAHIRVCYDPKGWNHYVWTADNLKYEDVDRNTVTDRYYYPADYTKPVAEGDFDAHVAKPGAGTWRGSSPIFRMCDVPGYENMNWVQYHYNQLKPIFEEYSDIIWAFDSGTFGPWGETHSNYEAEVPGHYKIILDSLLDAVPDGKPIMTHVGGFLDWYNRTYNTTYDFGTLDTFPTPVRGTPEARFGMFDDSNGWSDDEYSYGDNGSLTEGYRMLAHDPILPGYNPEGIDPSLTRNEASAPGAKVSSVIGYNDSGTNRLSPLPEDVDDPRWRGVWFEDWDRTKLMNFLGKMSVYGGEQIGREPASGTNGGFVPIGERIDHPFNDVILRFPSLFYEHSISRWTYMCMQQGSSSFKSRADYPYTRENIEVEITYPWNGQTVKVLYDPVYEGQSALAYYRDRMGYRLVLRDANASERVAQNGILDFRGKIQNVGWGEIFNKKAVKVLLKSKSGGFVSNAVLTNIDPYDWQPAEAGPNGEMPDSRATNTAAYRDLNFSINMGAFGEVPLGEYDIYLKINDPKEQSANKRSIRFANKGNGIWDSALGANLIGSTKIEPAIFNDDADIVFAKSAIENASYVTTQEATKTESEALAKVKEVIGTLALRGVSADISKVSYTAAVAGTSSNRSGVDGSYVFTVKLKKGVGTVVDTEEVTLTITATRHSGGGSSGGGATVPGEPGQTTTTETLKDGTIVTTVTDNATGNKTVTTKGPDGTVAVIDMPRGGAVTGKITLGSNVKDALVSVPVANANGGTVAILIHDDGTEEIIKNSIVIDGVLYVPVSSSANIKIVQRGKSFTDMAQAAWAGDAIAFVTARDLFFGTSDTKFSPNLAMTRGMMATVLYRLAGEMPMGENKFADVPSGQYYTDAVAWAAETGVVAGVGENRFAPNSLVTREQLAAMLYRFAGSPEVIGNLDRFDDNGQVSDWAKQAVTWAVDQGIIQGRTAGTLVPGANATRAEVAAMLQRFMVSSI